MPTPSKGSFIVKELATPNKDYSGIAKATFMHISSLHRHLINWLNVNRKAAKVCKAISALKLHECDADYFPLLLEPSANSLVEAIDALKNIVDETAVIKSQLQALAKLQLSEQPVIFTWSTTELSKCVAEIHECLLKEYRLKAVIVENIAHCRDEKLMEVYVSSWEFDVYLDLDLTAYLFAEVGLPMLL